MSAESWTWLFRSLLTGLGAASLAGIIAGVVALFRMHTSLTRLEAIVLTVTSHGRRITSVERFLMVKHGYVPRDEDDG